MNRIRKRTSQRRGVTLLMVISLIVMFFLFGTTFLVIASNYLKSSKQIAAKERTGEDPPVVNRRAFDLIMRGPLIAPQAIDWSENDMVDVINSNADPEVNGWTNSSVLGHDLLGDLYGNDWIRGRIRESDGGSYSGGVRGRPNDNEPQFLDLDIEILEISPSFPPAVETELIDAYNFAFNERVKSVTPPNNYRQVPRGFLSGRVFTLTRLGDELAPTRGILSTRIVDSIRDQVRITMFEGDAEDSLASLRGAEFIINGAPFNGSGAGLSVRTPNDPGVNNTTGLGRPEISAGNNQPLNNELVDEMFPLGSTMKRPLALLPNFVHSDQFGVANIGGADEDYDAPDFQNMYLAWDPPGLPKAYDPGDQTTHTIDVIPSFHRPELIKYWSDTNNLAIDLNSSNKADAMRQFRQLMRRICLRPLPADHPNFTGSNSSMSLLNQFDYTNLTSFEVEALFNVLEGKRFTWLGKDGSMNPGIEIIPKWDVDNDRDGQPDSVWIDAGLPVFTTPEGRLAKPLIAVLIKDMDGRFNLNAHGNWGQTVGFYTDPSNGSFAGGASGVKLPRGQGFGPAEVSLVNLLSPNAHQRLLESRYRGRDPQDKRPGLPNVDDPLSRIQNLFWPVDYRDTTTRYLTPPCLSPPDIFGLDGAGLDYVGMPFYASSSLGGGSPLLEQRTDDPYEIDLGSIGHDSQYGNDRPFTPAELERLLRSNDSDVASLESRLVTLQLAGRKDVVTTESRHIPVPTIRPPVGTTEFSPPEIGSDPSSDFGTDLYQQLSTFGKFSPSVLDMFRARLEDGLAKNSIPSLDPSATDYAEKKRRYVSRQVGILFPWEIKRGLKFDVNRWLGNGRDDNGNFVVDEPGERDTDERIWSTMGLAAGVINFFDLPNDFNKFSANDLVVHHLNDDSVLQDQTNPNPPRYAPQLYARHLYCTMMFLIDAGYIHPFDDTIGSLPKEKELTATRIAQWAINAVEFRDSDAIMQPFEFDINPFNGWQETIDGDPSTPDYPKDAGNNPITDPTQNERRVVWGLEFPDLVLTETIAFHDRRVADTADDANSKKRPTDSTKWLDQNEEDSTLDQLRIPQGSAFFELYAARHRDGNRARYPLELYTDQGAGSGAKLDLGRVTPADSAGNRWPVWQLAISDMDGFVGAEFLIEQTGRRDSITMRQYPSNSQLATYNVANATPFDPIQLNGFDLAGAGANVQMTKVDLERIVWFAPLNPTTNSRVQSYVSNPANKTEVFYARNGSLSGNQSSLVVSPGSFAVVAPRRDTFVGSRQVQDPANDYESSDLRFSVDLSGRFYTSVDGVTQLPSSTNTAVPPVAIIAAANTPATWSNPKLTSRGIGINISEPLPNQLDLAGATPRYYPEPSFVHNTRVEDGTIPDGYDHVDPTQRMNLVPDTPFDEHSKRPLGIDPVLLQTATHQRLRVAFLQRLANPLEGWHPLKNPYLTVDSATIDLTVFNGEEENKDVPGDATQQGWDPTDIYPTEDPAELFMSRERGDGSPKTDFRDRQFLWNNYWLQTLDPSFKTVSIDYFGQIPRQTLGYLNEALGPPSTSAPGQYVGSPEIPFPWFFFPDRSFHSPMELAQVPAVSPDRLGLEFNVRKNGPLYDAGTDKIDAKGKYWHLLNFMQTDGTVDAKPAGFYRIFDVVGMPSPFVGTRKWFNPAIFKQKSEVYPSSRPYPEYHSNNEEWSVAWRPPYNWYPTMRDPGRININTISKKVYQGLMAGYPDLQDAAGGWDKFEESRREGGWGGGASNPAPTQFAGVFRSATTGNQVPLDGLRQPGIEATLMRPETPGDDVPLFYSERTEDYLNSRENSQLHNLGMSRLSNLVSTNSNVFSIWITVGYFEVTPAPLDEVNNAGEINNPRRMSGFPDGFRLGQELGAETGNVKRYRSFYLIDRSIPVGYQQGKNLNVEDTILLERFID